MADIAVTANSVKPTSSTTIITGVAGATITAGQLVYLAAATGKYGLYDADSATAEVRALAGVAMNGAAADQALGVATKGLYTVGATVAASIPYFGSPTPGGICPAADIASGMYATLLGFGVSTTQILIDITPCAAVKA